MFSHSSNFQPFQFGKEKAFYLSIFIVLQPTPSTSASGKFRSMNLLELEILSRYIIFLWRNLKAFIDTEMINVAF